MRRLRDSGVPAKVLIIGDGPRRGEIERQIAELQLTGHAVIAGHRNDVRPYIACCDVMTLTSHVVETFSIAALESMALGKPMVLTRIGGAEEQVRHGTNGFLYERGRRGGARAAAAAPDCGHRSPEHGSGRRARRSRAFHHPAHDRALHRGAAASHRSDG